MKAWLKSLALLAAAAVVVWGVWQWFFCRFYVRPGYMAIITAKNGDELAPDQILAGPRQKGVRAEALGEGRHFLNPVFYDVEQRPLLLIPPGKVGVVTSKVGDDLPPGEFLAEPGQKGIWRRVLGPGKYRLNPYGYQVDIVDAISIPIGYAGVLTSLSGAPAPAGEFAAAGQKGVRSDVLQPGLYYVNPKEYAVDVLEIGVNQVSLLGKQGGEVLTKNILQPQSQALDQLQRNVVMEQQARRESYVQSEGKSSALASAPDAAASSLRLRKAAEKEKSLFAGEERADKDTRAAASPAPTFVLNQFVEFPSRDGFEISLDMTVEFELLPNAIADIYRRYGDLPAVVDKIIMPQILSISRLKGSAIRATDFIVGDGREKFQLELTEALAATLADRRLKVHNALIRHVNVPMQILDPVRQASIAVEQDLTNKEKQNTARKQAELNTEISLITQRRDQVAQETEKLQAEVLAQQQKETAEIGGETLKKVAELENRTAQIRAEKTRTLGRARADVVRLVDGEKAAGYQLKVAAFGDRRRTISGRWRRA